MYSHKRLLAVVLSVGLLLTACGGASTPAPAGSDLQGKTWLWQYTAFNNGKTIPVLAPASYTLQFLEGRKISLKADCNSGSGSYIVTNDVNLTIRVETMTKAACPAGSLSEEYVQELNDVGSYNIERDGELVLALKSTGAGMRFKPQ